MDPAAPHEGRRLSFVCRGSLQDGLGHVTRTVSVARAARDRGAATQLVLVGDGAAEDLAGALDEPVAGRVHDDADVVDLVGAWSPAVVAFDATHLDDRAFAAVAEGRATASLSPVFDHQHEVDRSYSRVTEAMPGGPAPPPERRRWGLRWTVVPPHVRPVSEDDFVAGVRQPTLSVGVSMGGADAPNRTLAVLEEIRHVDHPVLVWVMLGEGYSHSYEDLVRSLRRDHRHEIILARTTSSMWLVLRSCSLLILAGGTTTYEAAYAGLPSLNLLDRPERHFLVAELEARGALWSATGPDRAGAVQGLLDDVIVDRSRLLEAHRRGRDLIDGRGADRIAADLLDLGDR